MNYKKYQNLLKGFGAASVMLLASACGDGQNVAGGGSSFSSDAMIEANNFEEGKSGTWGDIVYGSADAPVTIVEYASLTCPHCATFAATTFPEIEKDYIETGKVRFIYRNFVMNGVDMVASTVARCRDMKTTKHLMKVFFSRQREWIGAEDRNAALASLARRTVNMSRTEFDRCASDRELMGNLTDMTKTATTTFSINSTPSIFVDGTQVTNPTLENLKKALDAAE